MALNMEYTYQGKNYPRNITLHHPELEHILGKDFDLMTRRDFETVMSLPETSATRDFEHLVLRELGRQWGKSADELKNSPAVNANIIPNALIYSVEPGFDGVSYGLLLEILRQSDDIIDFNLPPYQDDPDYPYAIPLLWIEGRRNPRPLKDFLLEEGIGHSGKRIVANMVGRLANLLTDDSHIEDYRQVIRDVLDAYIHDFPHGRICDRQVISYVVNAAADAGLQDLEGKISYIYQHGMVDESYCGDLDNTLFGLSEGAYMDEPVTDAFRLFFAAPTPYYFA